MAAAKQAQLNLVTGSVADKGSPLFGVDPEQVAFENGRIIRKGQPESGETFQVYLERKGGKPVSATESAQPEQDAEQFSQHSWGAVFAEVAVHEALGMVQVRRVIGVYDIGTLLNEKTGKSQLIGGIVWGVGLALHEATHISLRNGRTVNNNLAEYHVPVNPDIGEIDVMALNIPDTNFDDLGARGIGEIGITGSGAAVANAIYYATGKRMRHAPITPEMLMA